MHTEDAREGRRKWAGLARPLVMVKHVPVDQSHDVHRRLLQGQSTAHGYMVTSTYTLARKSLAQLVYTGRCQMLHHLDLFPAYNRQQKDVI